MGRLLMVALLVLGCSRAGFAEELRSNLPQLRQGPRPIEDLVGEHLRYKISFLWFNKPGEERIQFSPREKTGNYQAGP